MGLEKLQIETFLLEQFHCRLSQSRVAVANEVIYCTGSAGGEVRRGASWPDIIPSAARSKKVGLKASALLSPRINP
jgi:hypothetical protein